MPKKQVTVTLSADVARAVSLRAMRSGRRESEVIEDSLRRDFGRKDLKELWARVESAPEVQGLELATSELHTARREGLWAGGS